MSLHRFSAAASAAFVLCAGAGGASAAEPARSWTGFYLGANAGYGFATSSTTVTPNKAAGNVVFAPYFVPSVEPKPKGATVGIEAGYNYQFGRAVAGIATDISFGSISGSASGQAPSYVGGQLTTTVENKIDWYGSVRAKLGFLPADNLLLYITGGLAYGHVEATTTGSNVAGCAPKLYCVSGSTGGVSTGGIIGGGVEYAFARQWSLKAEYLAMQLPSRSVTFADPAPSLAISGGAYTADTSFRMQTVRVGLAYRFGN